MSSTPSSVEKKYSSPPAKKARTVAAASAPAATAPASNESPNVSAPNAAAAAPSAVDTASLAILERLGNLEKDVKALQKDTKAIQKTISTIEGRLDQMTVAFAPATLHALFECAIYEFVDKEIPSGWVSSGGKIKHGVASLCLGVMEKLLSESSKKLKWQGPLTKPRNGGGFPKAHIRPLVLAGLAGLKIFIKTQEQTVIMSWDSSDRNSVSHAGSFLSSLYSTPPEKDDEHLQAFGLKKAEVKATRKAFEEKAAERDDFPGNVEDGVSDVVAELESKGIEIDEDLVDVVVAELESLTATEQKHTEKQGNLWCRQKLQYKRVLRFLLI